jgi:hypothetical protein
VLPFSGENTPAPNSRCPSLAHGGDRAQGPSHPRRTVQTSGSFRTTQWKRPLPWVGQAAASAFCARGMFRTACRGTFSWRGRFPRTAELEWPSPLPFRWRPLPASGLTSAPPLGRHIGQSVRMGLTRPYRPDLPRMVPELSTRGYRGWTVASLDRGVDTMRQHRPGSTVKPGARSPGRGMGDMGWPSAGSDCLSILSARYSASIRGAEGEIAHVGPVSGNMGWCRMRASQRFDLQRTPHLGLPSDDAS